MNRELPGGWTLLVSLGLLLAILASGCRNSQVAPIELPGASAVPADTPVNGPSEEPTTVPTPTIPPTPTPQPAALVNGQPILLEDFEAELARYELGWAELGQEIAETGPENYRAIVLNALIERELLRQAALVYGIEITPQAVDEKIAELQESASEYGNFNDWLVANHWTLEEFREMLAAEMMVEAVVAEITADVPYEAEQVRARYIQVEDPAEAQSIVEQLNAGQDFAALAEQYSLDQATAPYGGDLGFFARGSLLVPAVEDVAFSLQPGEASDLITVADPESGRTTYYLVEVMERDPARTLSSELRYRLLQEAFETWLAGQKESATITYLVDVGS